MKIIDYVIADTKDVRRLLQDGFQLYGDPFITRGNDYYPSIVCQAMIKYDPKESELQTIPPVILPTDPPQYKG